MTLLTQPQEIKALAAQRNEYATAVRESKIRPVLLKMPVYCGLMKADLTRAPAIMPKLRLQGLRFLGRIPRQLIGCGCRFVGNPVLFIEPRAEIDESAAIAAEGSIDRFWRPFHRALAGRAFNDRCHRNFP
jgi:hypothetical protein